MCKVIEAMRCTSLPKNLEVLDNTWACRDDSIRTIAMIFG